MPRVRFVARPYGFRYRIYLDRYVYASQEVVLTAGPGALGDLFEKPAQALDASHFVQFADRVQHGRFVVVVPVIRTTIKQP